VCDDACTDCLKVVFRNESTGNDQYLRLVPIIVNTGSDPVPMSEIEMRYYFTNDSAPSSGHVSDCWHATPPAQCSTTTRTVVQMSQPVSDADFYLSVTFPSSSQIIQVSGQAGEFKLGVRAQDWTVFTQSNDHSYSGSTSFIDPYQNITLYQNGVKVWGTEP
jgi:endoglucanase